jgi:hypothetical protein
MFDGEHAYLQGIVYQSKHTQQFDPFDGLKCLLYIFLCEFQQIALIALCGKVVVPV